MDGGRALHAKAARCENTRWDALWLHLLTCLSPLSEARVCLADKSLRRVNISLIAAGESSSFIAQNRALQWSGNPYGNGYESEMDGNGAQFVNRLWIGLDLGEGHRLKTIQ